MRRYGDGKRPDPLQLWGLAISILLLLACLISSIALGVVDVAPGTISQRLSVVLNLILLKGER